MKKAIFLYIALIATTAALYAQVNHIPSTSKGNNSGNVGIGTTNPSEKLEVTGNIKAMQNLIAIGRQVYFGNEQRLIGNNTSSLTYVSNDNDITQFIMKDKDGSTHGRIYGENSGATFGLLDGDYNWSLQLAKDSYTAFLINNAEKMRITVGGDVGIGTASPQDKLHIVGGDIRLSTQRELFFENIGQIRGKDDHHRILFRTSQNILELREEGDILFSSGATTGQETNSMIIKNTGYAGIGTISPLDKLHVSDGDIRLSDQRELLFENSGQIRSKDSNHRILFRTNLNIMELREEGDILFSSGATNGLATNAMIINDAGNVGINTITPAHRFDIKLPASNIKTYDYGLEHTVNTASGWTGAYRIRNENNQSAATFGAHDGFAYIATGIDLAASPSGHLFKKLTVNPTGDVGIGVNNPTEKLDVAGKARINNIYVGGNHTSGFLDEISGLFNLHLNAAKLNNSGGDIVFLSDSQEKMKMLPNGNFGIGHSNPLEKLHIAGAIRGNGNGGALRVQTQNGYIDLGPQNNGFAHMYTDMPRFIFNKDVYTFGGFSSYSNNDLLLKTNGVSRLQIKSSNGNVGIGNSNPTEKLDVTGRVRANWVWVGGGPTGGFNDAVSGLYNLHLDAAKFNNIGGNIVFLSGGTQLMAMTPDGKLGIGKVPFYELDVDGYARAIDFYNGSDQRIKDNIQPISHSLQQLRSLHGKSYTLKADELSGFDVSAENGRIHYGFLAQEVQTVFPHLVRADNNGYLAVNYIGLIPVLVEALKEQEQSATTQQKVIDRQAAEINDLKARMDKLEAILLKDANVGTSASSVKE